MDNDISATTSAGLVAEVATRETPLIRNSTSDYSPDDADLEETAAAGEATRDTLADGLVARLLRPCVDRLDASVQCTRLSQLDLKLQLDSLAAELKRLSLVQHDYSLSSPQSLVSANKTNSPTKIATAKSVTDTCTLLDGYARRLCGARAKIAVVGNILESTQERLRALSHRIGREHNNRRSLLEPQIMVASIATEVLELEDDKDHNEKKINNDKEDQQQHNKADADPVEDNKEPQQSVESAMVIATSLATTEPIQLS